MMREHGPRAVPQDESAVEVADMEAVRARCDAIRARLNKTTPGPWRDRKSVHGNQYRYVQIGKEPDYTTLEIKPADARFIANARDDVLELLDYIAVIAAALTQRDQAARAEERERIAIYFEQRPSILLAGHSIAQRIRSQPPAAGGK
jgi:hypothetical protein